MQSRFSKKCVFFKSTKLVDFYFSTIAFFRPVTLHRFWGCFSPKSLKFACIQPKKLHFTFAYPYSGRNVLKKLLEGGGFLNLYRPANEHR